jgi:hypothetical protein
MIDEQEKINNDSGNDVDSNEFDDRIMECDNNTTPPVKYNNEKSTDDNNNDINIPAKQPNYREYTSQPARFRDDANILNYLHVRLGHQSDRTIKLMFKHNMITFLKGITYDKIKNRNSTPCPACETAKSSRRPSVITNMDINALKPFQVVCSDIIGKFDVLSKRREHYAVIYVCMRTGHIALYFIKSKDDVDSTITKYLTNYVNRYSFICKQLHADYDTVYRANSFRKMLMDIGIYSTFSAPYHHQGNGIAERSVRKVIELARALMIESQAGYSDTDIYIYGSCSMVFESNTKQKIRTQNTI